MKKAEYQDYLIEKPLCLIYCNLDSNFDIIKKHLYENFEIKEIKNLEDLIYWCKIAPVSMVIIGAKKLEEIKELGEFLNEKLPVEENDCKMDLIITEKRILYFHNFSLE